MARRHRGNIMTGTTRVNELAAHAEITTERCAARDDGRRVGASDAATAARRLGVWRGLALVRFALAMLLGSLFMAGAQAQANSVQAVSVARGSNDSQVVKISLAKPLDAEPVHFTTANPHRIVLDLADTDSSRGRLGETLQQGMLKAYNVVQAGQRTRVVLDLTGPSNYQVRRAGNQVLVVVQGAQVAPDGSVPARFAESGPKRDHQVRDVEFKRAASGEGRVIVSLSDPGVGVDIRQKGTTVHVDFLNTALPAQLRRRLDVSDFATPVQTVETVEDGKLTRMKVEARGAWDYSAYQTGEQFILEFRSLEDPRAQVLADRPRYTGEKLTLNFQNVEIRAVLQVIADFTGLNIIASDTVAGSITLRLKDVPWDQAMDIILRAKGLDKRTTGNVIWVAPRDELAAKEKLELESKQQIADLEVMTVESIPLNYLRANEAQAILQGQSVATLQGSEAVSCEAQATGVGGTTQQSATAAGTGATDQRVLSKRGSATFDLKTNTLFVQDTPSKLRAVRELLNKIDVPTRQVMIEARIVIADDSFSRDLGVKLGFKGRIGNGAAAGTSGTAENALTGAAAGSIAPVAPPLNVNLAATGALGTPASLGFAIIEGAGNAILSLEIQALELDNRGKVLSNPRVITSNQKPAVIMQGEEIPYLSGGGTTGVVPTTSFKNAVLCLLVDPQILNNDNIILDVEVTKDARGENTTAGPTIDKKRVKTSVRLADGETAVLGGIFEQTLRNDTLKVPFLGDLPVLGSLFRSNFKTDEKTELLIFLTPRILPENFAQSTRVAP